MTSRRPGQGLGAAGEPGRRYSNGEPPPVPQGSRAPEACGGSGEETEAPRAPRRLVGYLRARRALQEPGRTRGSGYEGSCSRGFRCLH